MLLSCARVHVCTVSISISPTRSCLSSLVISLVPAQVLLRQAFKFSFTCSFVHHDGTSSPPRQHARHSAIRFKMQPLQLLSHHSHPSSALPRRSPFTSQQLSRPRQLSSLGLKQQGIGRRYETDSRSFTRQVRPHNSRLNIASRFLTRQHKKTLHGDSRFPR